MSLVRKAFLSALLAVIVTVSVAPAASFAANAYGQVFAGQQACLQCHGDIGGKWQVGTYLDTAHARFVTDAQSPTTTLSPAVGSALWPSPWFGGISFAPADVFIQFGGADFVSLVHNDATHTLSTGASVSPTTSGPPDDHLMFSGIAYEQEAKAWSLSAPVSVRPYFQGCGGCHFLGVTRPTDTTRTLASGVVVGHATETSWAGLGIQCENCHGTGGPGAAHWTTGVGVVRTKRVLKSQTCGQCHVTGMAKEKNYAGKTFSSPNGFTPDRELAESFDVYGTQYVKTSPTDTPASIPATDTRFYPGGQNKGMNHGYYNEWMLSAHARSLRYEDGSLWSSHGQGSCLRCHSGEGFLKDLGYGADDGNDIALLPSSVASDTLNVECGVCHTVHAPAGDPLGLRLPADELCGRCHSAGIAEGGEVAPGARLTHVTREMFEGYGLIGVARAEPFMGDAECPDCHMPRSYGDRPSHRFTPVSPGDAAGWGVPANGDSCTPCHMRTSREDLQADLVAWDEEIATGVAEVTAAIASASARPASSTAEGRLLLDSARTDLAFVQADGSGGAHNLPYAMAGLAKAVYFADAVGAAFDPLAATSYDMRSGLAFVYGKLRFGDGSTRGGRPVTIEARPAGSESWAIVGTVLTGGSGDFSCAVGPEGTTSYRAVWAVDGADVDIVSSAVTVVCPSRTSLTRSAGRVRLGGTVALRGRVTPVHEGGTVTVQYRYGRYAWRTLVVKTLGPQSAYSLSFKPPARGLCYFRAVFGGDEGHLGSTSGVVAVRAY